MRNSSALLLAFVLLAAPGTTRADLLPPDGHGPCQTEEVGTECTTASGEAGSCQGARCTDADAAETDCLRCFASGGNSGGGCSAGADSGSGKDLLALAFAAGFAGLVVLGRKRLPGRACR